MAAEQLVRAYCNGNIFSFERAEAHAESWFGGPFEDKLIGIEYGPKPLHLIARLALGHFTGSTPTQFFAIPLIYGMYYSGCDIEYRIRRADETDPHKIELRKLSPTESSDDWPYPHFPPLLPYVPLQLGETRAASYEEFAEGVPNMPRLQPTELVVVVPPPATLGLSLWGSGDAEGVTIVFECDLADRVVYACNRTS
jgi:hypothetical protein